jgi:hypothetical protein
MNPFLAAKLSKMVRRDITPYFDVSAAVNRLGLTLPIWIYDAKLGDGALGVSFPMADKHCLLVDLLEVRRAVRENHADPSVRHYELEGQLPDRVPFTFENLLRADIVHEMSHLRISKAEAKRSEIFQEILGYDNDPEEERARACGRELFPLVKITNLQMLQL